MNPNLSVGTNNPSNISNIVISDGENNSNKKKNKNSKLKKKNPCKKQFIIVKKSKNAFIGNFVDITYDEIDSKINHNEPLYCFCNYISFGSMIKCDNDNVRKFQFQCKKEWFHFKCVGLECFPKGSWYCSEECAYNKK